MSRPWYFKVSKNSNKINVWRNGAALGDEKKLGTVSYISD